MARVKNTAPAAPAVPSPEFTAAVRYLDGRRELIRIRKADDIADARQVVFDALVDVCSVVIAERCTQDWLRAA